MYYNVYMQVKATYFTCIEADSLQEAIEKADDEFDDVDTGDLEAEDVKPVLVKNEEGWAVWKEDLQNAVRPV